MERVYLIYLIFFIIIIFTYLISKISQSNKNSYIASKINDFDNEEREQSKIREKRELQKNNYKKEGVQGSIDTLNKRTAFLEDIPSDSEAEITGISFKKPSCINYINKLSADGNHIDAVRWINKALSLDPAFDFEIVLRRNRCVALGELFGIGRNGHRRNLDYCIVAEHVTRDFEAIIGLYVTNENEIKGRDNSSVLDNSFEMALHNLMPVGLSNMAYQNVDGSHVMYDSRLPRTWKVDFVNEPPHALRVNGNIYPQYKLPK